MARKYYLKGEKNMYTLVDGVAQNQLHPETFEIPTKEELSSLRNGKIVKLGFEEEGKLTERMWVSIVDIGSDKSEFKGVLDNIPAQLDTVKYQDIIKFEAKNILAIFED